MRLIHTLDLDRIKDTKMVIQCSKRTDNTLGKQNKSRQTNTQKIKDQATRILLKTGWGN